MKAAVYYQTGAPDVLRYEDVADIRQRRVVGDDTGEADGARAAIGVEPEVQRALDAAPHDVERDAGHPVRLLREPALHHLDVELRGVGADDERVAAPLLGHQARFFLKKASVRSHESFDAAAL